MTQQQNNDVIEKFGLQFGFMPISST